MAASMREIHGVADDPPARRRWFHDDFFDLFVWEVGEEVTLFQLCYGAHSSERALVWRKDRGLYHDGSREATQDREGLRVLFGAAAKSLPEHVRQAVDTRLREYASAGAAVTTRRRMFRRDDWQRRAPGADKRRRPPTNP